MSIASSPQTRYTVGAQAASEVAAATIWLVLWCVNGLLTVLYLGSWGLAWPAGILAHLVISLIEHHLWRGRRRSTYPLIFAVGLVDVYSSAHELLRLALGYGVPLAYMDLVLLVTALAMAIAIAPEPQFVDHLRALRRNYGPSR